MLEFYIPSQHSNKKPFVPYPFSAGDLDENESPIEWLSLDDYVADSRDAILYVKVRGDSMVELDIYTGDLVVVDRLRAAENGAIVLARIGSTFTIKKLKDLETYRKKVSGKSCILFRQTENISRAKLRKKMILKLSA